MRIGLGLSIPELATRSNAYSVQVDLGAVLLAYWDADRSESFSLSGSSVSSWTDVIGNAVASQAVAGSKPAYAATGLNGGPVVNCDGVDDCLTLTGIPTLPTGSVGCRIYMLMRQDSAVADATTRYPLSYGGGASTSNRSIARRVSGGKNIARVTVGDGTVAANADDLIGDFSGVCVVTATFSPTQSGIALNDGTPVPVGAVPATGTARLRIGSFSASTAANFFQGGFVKILITSDLISAGQELRLRAYLKQRGGVA